jgi:hypothetical protein
VWALNKTILSLLFLISFGQLILFSQAQDKEPNILVYIHSMDTAIRADLKKVINNTISTKLKVSGFNVIKVENETDISDLLDTAEWMGAYFVIDGSYLFADGVVSSNIACYSVWDREILLSVSNTNKLSLSTDQYIDDTLSEIIPVIQQNLYVIEQRNLFAELKQKDKPIKVDKVKIEETIVLIVDMPLPVPELIKEYIPDQKQISELHLAQERENNQGLDVLQSLEHNEPEVLEEDTNEAQSILSDGMSSSPFSINLGVSPLLTTGEATQYFASGIDFSLFGGYRLSNSAGYLVFGVYTALDYFKANGMLISSENILISFGPELRAGLELKQFAAMFVRFSTGGTVFMIDANNTGYRTMLVPYISAGLGVDYFFLKNIGISFISNYNLYMEASTLISGFLPSFAVNFRF